MVHPTPSELGEPSFSFFFRALNLQILYSQVVPTESEELKNNLFFQKITILEITGCFAFLRAPGVFRITYWVYTNIVKAFKPSVSDFCWLWVHLPPFSVYTHLYLPLRSQSQIPPIFQKNHDFEDCMPLGESLTGVDCFKPLTDPLGTYCNAPRVSWESILLPYR